ncbi:MAG: hypothetical protein WBG46_11190 [Nonlabens sp.]
MVRNSGKHSENNKIGIFKDVSYRICVLLAFAKAEQSELLFDRDELWNSIWISLLENNLDVSLSLSKTGKIEISKITGHDNSKRKTL